MFELFKSFVIAIIIVFGVIAIALIIALIYDVMENRGWTFWWKRHKLIGQYLYNDLKLVGQIESIKKGTRGYRVSCKCDGYHHDWILNEEKMMQLCRFRRTIVESEDVEDKYEAILRVFNFKVKTSRKKKFVEEEWKRN